MVKVLPHGSAAQCRRRRVEAAVAVVQGRGAHGHEGRDDTTSFHPCRRRSRERRTDRCLHAAGPGPCRDDGPGQAGRGGQTGCRTAHHGAGGACRCRDQRAGQAGRGGQPARPAKPAEAPKPAAQGGLGSQLVGKIEGPTILPEAKRPPKLGEAPMLADLVKAGKFPPVEQRIPDEPLVIKPLAEIGRYGGAWRRAFTGPGDNENGNRIMSSDKPIFWNYDGTKVEPSVAKAVADRRRREDLHADPA